jgi:hypothetical protein
LERQAAGRNIYQIGTGVMQKRHPLRTGGPIWKNSRKKLAKGKAQREPFGRFLEAGGAEPGGGF